jgi:hypothetical protein
MTKLKKTLALGALAITLLGTAYVCIRWYPFVFSKDIQGEIVGVERVTQPSTVISTGGEVPSAQVFSFAVAIKTKEGEIYTSSTEDRQWAVAQKGQCAEVRLLPYAPWEFEKAGTYHGARLLKLIDCAK